jgi:hypothetical protein
MGVDATNLGECLQAYYPVFSARSCNVNRFQSGQDRARIVFDCRAADDRKAKAAGSSKQPAATRRSSVQGTTREERLGYPMSVRGNSGLINENTQSG